MQQRKRLNARSFRHLHEMLAKKHKITPICGKTFPDDGSDILEVKSGPGDGELTNKKSGDGLQVDSSDHEKHGSGGENKDEVGGDESKGGMAKEISECKSSSPRLSEYWVPVGFSCLQLEKYCETLVNNLGLLCSSKKGNTHLLHDVLSTIKKCCDHPYIVDPSLETFVNEGLPVVDKLTKGIEVSGKLQLLDKFLQGVREKQLRGVIVFQSNSNSLRYILDDFVCRRFGEDSYVHIYREVDNTKRRAALDLFNDKSSGRSLLLVEKSSCQSSIRLSLVDFVLLFNSDWNPVNDMKALQKMTIQAEHDCVKVFRLYSVDSVEEKALISATKGVLLESSISSFTLNSSHALLQWGASRLFSKLGDFHSSSSFDDSNISAGQKLLHDVLHELSVLLSPQEGDSCSCSCVAKVPETNDFSGISLYGVEAFTMDEDIPPSAVWISLLEEKNPQWKLLPGSSGRFKRRGQSGSKDHIVMSINTVLCGDESLSLSPKVRKARTPTSRRKSRKFFDSGGIGANLFPRREFSDSCIESRRMKKLLLNQKKDIREFHRVRREERGKLEKEHQSELALINDRFGGTAGLQYELKKLDDIYKAKIKNFDRKMDMRRKKLVDGQRAARAQLNQTRADLERPISLPCNQSVLNSELQSQAVELVEKPVSFPVPVSDSECQPESHVGKGVEHDTVEKEILAEESNGENDAATVTPLADGSNTAVHNDSIVEAENRVSQSTSDCRKLSQDVQHVSDTEIEGVESTNMEPLEDVLLGGSVRPNTHPTGSLSQSLESQGDNSVMLSSEKAPETSIKALNDGALNLCASVEHQPSSLAGEKNVNSLSNVAYEELVDEGHNTEVPVGTSNGGTECGGGVDLEAASVASEPRVECELDNPDARLATSSPTLVLPDTRNEEAGGHGRSCMDIPSSVSVQPQACATTGNSPLLEQPVSAIVLPSRGLRQNDVPLVVPSFQTVSQLQSSVPCDITPPSNLTAAPNLPPSIGRPEEISSSRPSLISPSTGLGPLQIELLRMRKEEEEAVRLHMDKVKDFESKCKKEMEEIRKKYDLLVAEADKALQQKKEDIGSYYTKVRANQMLAEAMLFFNLDGRPECPSSPIQQQLVMQQQLALQQQQQLSQRAYFPNIASLINQHNTNVTRYPLVGHHHHPQVVPTSPLPYFPVASFPVSQTAPSMYELQTQQARVPCHGSFPGSYPMDRNMMPREGCQESPIQL